MLLEDGTCLFVTHQQSNVLKDLQRGSMRAFNLLLREKGGKIDQWILLVAWLRGFVSFNSKLRCQAAYLFDRKHY
jgi:hypothetical protein